MKADTDLHTVKKIREGKCIFQSPKSTALFFLIQAHEKKYYIFISIFLYIYIKSSKPSEDNKQGEGKNLECRFSSLQRAAP